MRWWDEEGNLLLWSSEEVELERQRAETEKQRAEAAIAQLELERQRQAALVEKLRQLGIEPEAES